MSQPTVLVIDDSATIRKLVDTHLSAADYRVVLAGNAEDGLRLVGEILPDVILLDHQLPGTTGFEVCRQLCESPLWRSIPVIISSTLRKKAYAEYTDSPNVVDMLPKPYTPELLTTTVANAVDTGSMIVSSQTEGTAVPEVIQEEAEADLSGTFSTFSLREVLDFLTNGQKNGALKVEGVRSRVWFYLRGGRIQGVSANGVSADEICQRLPESLGKLAPVLKMTLGGRGGADWEGILQLLDQKVLDPRLMTWLLRFQASALVMRCFTQKLLRFSFDSRQAPPALYQKLSLDISLLALLVEGAMHEDESQLPDVPPEATYVRRALRGQNLDRAGLSAHHLNILSLLANPRTREELTQQLKWEPTEVQRVLHGLTLAELVHAQLRPRARQFVLFEPDAKNAEVLRQQLSQLAPGFLGKTVRDVLALRLLLKRDRPQAILFDTREDVVRAVQPLLGDNPIKRVGLIPRPEDQEPIVRRCAQGGLHLDTLLARTATPQQWCQALERLFSPDSPPPVIATPVRATPATTTSATTTPRQPVVAGEGS